ncbi:hypothetical protein FJU08_01205 [Martelella alba]|uniref:Uncharacterized protein n=1 Tax=Martelella alba TaxID=2590451 RepID=A0A506UIT6_9HYPH|nr:hypothetical protein [Martelella alba]TPW33212.1 hypothetical protein FJU08_01205 [Martelella alba]
MKQDHEMREALSDCEACGKLIFEGDPQCSTSDGITLCEDCAPMLSEVLDQAREIEREHDEDRLADWNFDTFDELREWINESAYKIAHAGDRKVLDG